MRKILAEFCPNFLHSVTKTSHNPFETKKLEKQDATVYKGVKGVMSALESQLIKGKEILGFGATAKLVEKVQYFYKYFFPKFHKKRTRLKIPMKAIFSEDNKKRGKEMKKMTSLLEIKYIPKEFSFPISLTVIGNKTLIITWSAEPYAFEIQSKDVADSMKAYFKALWKIAKNE